MCFLLQWKLKVSLVITATQTPAANQIIAEDGVVIHLFTQSPSVSDKLESYFIDYRICLNHSLHLSMKCKQRIALKSGCGSKMSDCSNIMGAFPEKVNISINSLKHTLCMASSTWLHSFFFFHQVCYDVVITRFF